MEKESEKLLENVSGLLNSVVDSASKTDWAAVSERLSYSILVTVIGILFFFIVVFVIMYCVRKNSYNDFIDRRNKRFNNMKKNSGGKNG